MQERPSREEVYDEHFDSVYAYIAYRVAPDREAAQDITQSVFLAAFESWSSFRGECSVLSWLRMIARNKIADYFRARSVGTERVDWEEVAGRATAGEPFDSPSQERALQVSIVLRQLPAVYAVLLEEKYLDGLPVRTIAQRHGQSEKAIESALARAREAFRAMYRRLQASDETDPEELMI